MKLFFTVILLTANLTPCATAWARTHRHSTIRQKIFEKIDETVVSTPTDQETCFSPDEPCQIKLKKFLASATRSIDIAIYDINEESIVHELLTQSKKIPVRILVDRKQAKGRHSQVPLLIRAGAQVRFGRQRGIMHNKFAIVDSRMVQLGSFNYTFHASHANNENQIYLANPKVTERFIKRFQKIWTESDPVE